MATRLFADDSSAGTFTDFILRCFEWIDRPNARRSSLAIGRANC
ncbi:hypothetical protein [Streptomyces sp. Ncost-T10-10d]|nr:hypothetical protein [Streptomyces sp. Ncost-T10-10d]SCF67127.1 hypothetical protein GA0115254_110646 [Streptomyces sp. Ncost-T10-10d]